MSIHDLGAGALPYALGLFAIVLAGTAAAVAFAWGGAALRWRRHGAPRARIAAPLRYGACVGAYLYAAILPTGLVRRQLLVLTDHSVHEIAVAYGSLIAALLVLATVLALEAGMRRRRAVVIGFFCAVVLVCGSGLFVFAALATAGPAAQPLRLLGLCAAFAPGPIYFQLRYQLGWL
jgi:hypothetical protein